jgi:uncharacterized membrane protein
MTGPLLDALVPFAALGSAVLAGIYFIFSVAVMPALARRPEAEAMAAMREINRTILNPAFFAVFFGTPVASAIVAGVALFDRTGLDVAYLVTGGGLALVGAFLVTLVFNVPLNNALEASEPGSSGAAEVWKRYLAVWTVWNHIRAVASLAAAAAFLMALG